MGPHHQDWSRAFRIGSGAVVVGMLALAGDASRAQEVTTTKLEGDMFIAGKTPLDPPTNEPKNTHAYVSIEGPAALRIYQTMKGREAKDLCRGEGWKRKAARNFVCSLSGDGKQAACDFSVDLRRGTIDGGKPC